MSKASVYDLKSLINLLSKTDCILMKIPEKFTTKQNIKYRCGCGVEHTKTYAAIKKSGGLCIECMKDQTNKKREMTHSLKKSQGIKRVIHNPPNKEYYAKRRKFTKHTLNNILSEYEATFQNNDCIPDKIGTKMIVEFVCKCGNNHKKQVRDFERTGAMCKKCTSKNKSQLISDARTKVLDPINNTNTHSRCKNCRNVYSNAYFIHTQSNDIETEWCQICRDKKKVHNNTLRNKRLISTCNDTTKKKCTSCLMWRDKIEFDNDNTTCLSICRKSGKICYLKLKDKCAGFNASNETIKQCIRCWKKTDIKNFVTERNHTSVVCETCRLDIFEYKDSIADHYIQHKIDNSVCIDCGLDDIRVIEFDHINQKDKLLNVSYSQSITQLDIEIKKCVPRCGICHVRRTKVQLNYGNRKSIKKNYVNEIKKQIGGCVTCGWYDENLLEALQFDHIDKTTKSMNISDPSCTIEDIKTELPKCQLLCIHCHKLKTIEDNGYYLYLQYSLGITRQELRNEFQNTGDITFENIIKII
jgi:hypothetical protein